MSQKLAQKDTLKKNVFTVHCANVLSLLQRKLANALLFNAYDTLQSGDEHQISISDLCEIIGYNSNSHREIKNALMELISTVVEWDVIEETASEIKETWNASAVIADASISGSICSYSYSKRMRELLYRPEMYARLNMRVQSKFKSSYGLALYENCVRYQNLKQTPWFKIDIFRKLMGVSDDKYSEFRHFKRKVVEPAVSEVNKHAGIQIDPEYKRISRKVTEVRFLISRNAKSTKFKLDSALDITPRSGVVEMLMDKFKLSTQQAADIKQKFAETVIREKAKIIEESNSYQQGKIRNLARYFLDAMEKDYQPACSSADVIQTKARKKAEMHLQQYNDKKRAEEQQNAYSDYQREFSDQVIENMGQSELKALQEEFINQIPDDTSNFLLKKFKKSGLNDSMVRGSFRAFLRENYGELFSQMKSFNAFCREQCEEIA